MIIGLLIIIGVLVSSCWMLFATSRRLRRHRVSRGWWLAYGGLSFVGLALGGWLAFGFEYHLSATVRVSSFPLPLCVFQLENAQWVDYPVSEYAVYPVVVTNMVAVTALATLPLLLASLLAHRRGAQANVHSLAHQQGRST
jgi:hypothetical protein